MKYGPAIIKKITTLIESGDYTIKEICTNVGITKETFYDWKHNKPDFSDLLKKAEDNRLEVFRQAARNGLLVLLQGKEFEEVTTEYKEGKPDASGQTKPKITSQKKVKKFIAPNPTSVIFALKNLDDQNFMDMIRQEVTGKGGGAIKIMPTNIDYSQLDADTLEKIANARIDKSS